MDWGAVTPNLITGVVGIAGIVGSIVSARIARKSATENLRTSISAEDRRTRIAEKRRIYAAFVAAINVLVPAYIMNKNTQSTRDAGERKVPSKDAVEALTSMLNTLAELELVAPENVTQYARQLRERSKDFMHDNIASSARIAYYNDTYSRLLKAMRADLGEPMHPCAGA